MIYSKMDIKCMRMSHSRCKMQYLKLVIPSVLGTPNESLRICTSVSINSACCVLKINKKLKCLREI